jgi:hypothetical protein
MYRVARFFLVQHTKTGENIPNDHKIYQMAINISNGRKIHQMDIKYTKFTQIGIFLFENEPSGIPAYVCTEKKAHYLFRGVPNKTRNYFNFEKRFRISPS